MNKACEYCPFRDDPSVTCIAISTGHSRFCQTVDPSDDSYSPRMIQAVRRLTLEPIGRWTETPVIPASMPVESSRIPPVPSSRPSVSLSLRRIKLVKACPWFVRMINCGCGVNRCLAGMGKLGEVSIHECISCVSARYPEPG
jgi:hypothetical protein